MSSTDTDTWTSFAICVLFTALVYFIALAKASGSVLNRSGEKGQPTLVSDFSGNALSFVSS